MLRALLWKEWREQRQIAAAGIGVALLLPPATFGILMASVDAIYAVDVVDMIAFMMAIFVWPLFAGLAGATTSAEETDAGSLNFLLSRPVSRTRVWATKVVVAAVAVGLVINVSFFVAKALGAAVTNRIIRFPFSSDPVRSSTLPPAGVQVAVLGFTLITFAVAVFLSMFLRRQVAAALGAATVAGGIVVLGARLQSLLSATPYRSDGAESFLAAFFLAAGAAILFGALYVFVDGGMLSGVDKRRPLGRAAAGAVLVVLLATVVSAEATTRIDPETAHVSYEAALPDGSGVLVRLQRNSFSGYSYAIAAAGKPLVVLTERMAVAASVSPDGEWVVYGMRLGWFGTRREACELRAVRVDGRDDHAVLAHAPCSLRLAFSSDGTHIAMTAQNSLWIAPVDGSEAPRSHHLLTSAAVAGTVVTWIRDDTRVLTSSRRGLATVDVDTGQVSNVHGNDGTMQVQVRDRSESAAVIRERSTRGNKIEGGESVPQVRLAIVDFETGVVRDLPSSCPDSYGERTLSADGKTVVFKGCEGRDDRAERQLHLYRVDTGERRMLAELDQEVVGLYGSPAASRLFVRTWNYDTKRRRNAYRNFVIDAASGARLHEVDGAWYAADWVDDDRLVIWRRPPSTRQIAFFHVDSGEIEILVGQFPNPPSAQ